MSGLATMRKECLTWPDASEREHFGKPAFYVGKSLFATCDEEGLVVIGLEPEHASALIDTDARFSAYPRAKHAVTFSLSKVSEWKSLLRESYDLASAPKKPKKPGAKSSRRRR
jgi:hypothetical protein